MQRSCFQQQYICLGRQDSASAVNRDKDRIANLLRARAATGLPPPYANAEAVNDELLDLLIKPAAAEGAVDVFVACVPFHAHRFRALL